MNKVRKAGCILINSENKTVALVYREKQNDYTFPKGHLEENESLIECALRETAEETKRAAKILEEEPIYIEKYKNTKEDVEVYYYLAKDIGPSDNTSTDTHKTIFLSYIDIKNYLTYDSTKELWKTISEKLLKYYVN